MDHTHHHHHAPASQAPPMFVAPEPGPPAKAPAAAGVEWTCPMHPEIVRSGPGTCPICGMALEPRTPTLEAENPELRDMTSRFWIAVALTAPLLVLTMAEMFGVSLTSTIGSRALVWVQLVLATPVVVWAGACSRASQRPVCSTRPQGARVATMFSPPAASRIPTYS
jgi:Cu+-exporting ATPase